MAKLTLAEIEEELEAADVWDIEPWYEADDDVESSDWYLDDWEEDLF